MIKRDLKEFMDNVNIVNDKLSIYGDKEGNVRLLSTIQLFANVDYLELTDTELSNAKFQNIIDDIEYKTIEVDRPVSKYEETKEEEDKYVLTNKKTKVYQIWNVSNGFQVGQSITAHKSFNSQEEAIEYADSINDEVLPIIK